MKITNSCECSPNPAPRYSEHALVGAETLLEILFPNERDRPCLRWLRKKQDQKLIPFKKIGRLVRFDAGEVRSALDRQFAVEANPAALTRQG